MTLTCTGTNISSEVTSASQSNSCLLLLVDVDVSSPDEKSVITYVSSLYDAFPKVPEGGEGIGANVSAGFSAPEAFGPLMTS